MSTLRTNALEGVDTKNSITIVAGAGNITTTNVQEGLAKTSIRYPNDQASITSSFNTSSVEDNGTGVYIPTVTNNMNSTTYSTQANALDKGSYYLNTNTNVVATTSTNRIDNMRQDFSTMQDPDTASALIIGDLA